MDMVCEHLNLLEKDYFGLTFADADTQKVSEIRIVWTVSGHKHIPQRTICIPLSCWLTVLYQGHIIHHSYKITITQKGILKKLESDRFEVFFSP